MTDYRPTATQGPQSTEVSLIAKVLGLGAAVFGLGLTVLTLAGAVDGFAAIGFYDIVIGSMCVAFGLRAVTLGYAVVYGRLTITGEAIAG